MSDIEENIFYVYVYLDPRKPGHYVYGEYEFDYEPFYIGKGSNGRLYDHLYKRKRNIKHNRHFYNKISKIQRECCVDPIIVKVKEIITEEISLDLEIAMITTIGRYDLKKGPLCNLTDGGEGVSGKIVTEETRKKLSEINKGLIVSEETKKKISMSKKGHIVTEETRRKISMTLKGHK